MTTARAEAAGPSALDASRRRATFIVLALFADGIFFAAHGAAGRVYVGDDDVTFRVFKAVIGAAAVLLFVNAFVHSLRSRHRPTRADAVFASVLVFVAVAVLIGWVRYPDSEAMQRYSRLFVSLTVPMMLLVFGVRRGDVRLMARPLMTVSGLVAALMLVARLRGGLGEGAELGVGGASHLAVGTAMAAAWAIHIVALVQVSRRRTKIIHAVVMAVAIYLIADSGSRGALVSVAVVTVVVLTLGRGLLRRPFISMGLIAAGYIGWSFVIGLHTTHPGIQKIQALVGEDAEAPGGRVNLLGVAWDMFLQSPVLGNGVGSFSERLGYFVYPHNLVMELLVDYGIVGLVAVVLGGWALFRNINSGLASESEGVKFVAVLAVSTLSGMMFSGSYLTYGSAWLIIGILAVRCSRSEGGHVEPGISRWNPGRGRASRV